MQHEVAGALRVYVLGAVVVRHLADDGVVHGDGVVRVLEALTDACPVFQPALRHGALAGALAQRVVAVHGRLERVPHAAPVLGHGVVPGLLDRADVDEVRRVLLAEALYAAQHGEGGAVVGLERDLGRIVRAQRVQQRADVQHVVHALHAPLEQIPVREVAPDDVELAAKRLDLRAVLLAGTYEGAHLELVGVLEELLYGLGAHHSRSSGEEDYFLVHVTSFSAGRRSALQSL